ncbi:unnamed protein product [Rotaria sp. Silwood2]|nr:unnamed protein product [Rotaria sp. Silwood2]CAF2835871.1 unnamed protein product [Rotaria sp. Silwood2]CAF3133038.1 unnamed protein product [Rotaria sp. Silwood2]CAF3227314.1 unnamed protein product [Rotaria sp. Silwood2]CAF4201635.1 unnamed protein product [Rotaria sp. Silwood2]
MSHQVNIRTVSGNKLNPLLPSKFQRVQNRAAAIWDAWNEDGRGLALELVAHLHRISAERIYCDIYGNSSDVDKRFGIEDSTKLERTLHISVKTTTSTKSPLKPIENSLSAHEQNILKHCSTNNTAVDDTFHCKESLHSIALSSKMSTKRSSTQMTNTCSSTNTIYSYQTELQNITSAQTESTFGKVQNHQQNNHSESLTISTNDKQTVNKHSMRPYHRTSISSFSDLMNWTCLNQHGIGLENCGRRKSQQNICYLNAIFQCLANTAPFAQWLLFNANGDQSRRIHEISSVFVIGRQEDPSEVFHHLLAHMTECLSPIHWTPNINYLSTVIQDLFGVQLQSLVVCGGCRNVTSIECWDSMWNISINSKETLCQFLTDFCKPELLCGENAYQCLQCNQLVSATKSYHLIKALPIIAIHLKRFVYDRQTNTTRKIKTFVSYPALLDLTSYFDKNSQNLNTANSQNTSSIYELYAVVVYLGEEPTSGHIYAYIRSPDALWYKANDKTITPVDIKQVFTNTDAYMLFYSKVTEDKLVFNEIILNSNTTSLSQKSSPFSTLSPLETHENKETTNHQDLVKISPNQSPKHQFNSSMLNESLDTNVSQQTTYSLNSSIEIRFDVNNEKEMNNECLRINENLHFNDTNNNNIAGDGTLSSSISHRQHSRSSIIINASPDNRSNTSESHISTSQLNGFFV